MSGPGPGGGRLGRRQPECRLNRQQARQHARCSGLGGSQARSRLLSRRRWLVSKIEGLHRGSAGRRLLDGQGWAGNRRDRQESREPDRQPASQPFASMRQRSRRHARPLPGAAERVVAKVRSIEGWSPPQMPSRRMNRSAHRVLLQGEEVLGTGRGRRRSYTSKKATEAPTDASDGREVPAGPSGRLLHRR